MSNTIERVTPDAQRLKEVVAALLREARDHGVDQAEAGASHQVGLSATARLGDVENLEYTNDRGVGITVYKQSCKGSASTSDFSPESLSEAVSKACAFAENTAADPHSGLADAALMATEFPDLKLAHDWPLDAEEAIRLAIECEDAARSADARIENSEGATVGTANAVRAYGNSHGFLSSNRKTSHSISCAVLGMQDGTMQRDYWYTTSRNPAALLSPAEVGLEAARRTVARLGAKKISTTRAPVLFAPELARGFMGHAVGALSGGAQYRRASFLLEAAGEKLFSDFVQIHERPHLECALASANYDAEGVATRDRDLVVDGVIAGYVLSSYSARRLGLTTTANAGGIHNLVIPGNAGDKNEIISSMQRGLLVTELIGQGVNNVTGDYSRGAVGFWIENGEIVHPVHEVTIAGNLRDLYGRILAIGKDQDLRGGIRCGSVLVDDMTIAGD
ncbi:MAG: metalloprotease PmbA [Woeseia sp.]|nr:metalloprotease PmbA [Woeseia sp.]